MITVAVVLAALRADTGAAPSGPVLWVVGGVRQGRAVPEEIWLQEARLWVQEDGRRVSGYPTKGEFSITRFGWPNAWRIRRAVRAWDVRRATTGGSQPVPSKPEGDR